MVDFVNLDVRDAQIFSETLRFSVSALCPRNCSGFSIDGRCIPPFVHNKLMSCQCVEHFFTLSNSIACPSSPTLGYVIGVQWAR